jgi:16S rRNA G966 N2-methylase RsmD
LFTATDEKLIKDIENKVENNKEYWDFRKNSDSKRDYVHNMFSYPAMMVPKMQRELLNMVVNSTNQVRNILDPFVGSGTILVEGMLRGLDVTGIDINPLAILICKVKTTPLNLTLLSEKIKLLESRIQLNAMEEDITTTSFDGINKWFKKQIIKQLDYIKNAIREESQIELRRFFWVSFCQTVRLVSNSRSVTFKLHIKNEKDIEDFNLDAIEVFCSVLNENFFHFSKFINELKDRNLLTIINETPYYKYNVDILYGDSREIIQNDLQGRNFDLLFTSPPYGDNHTTVTYGQYSVLQLRWMDIDDIGLEIDKKVLETNSEIDKRSLGGIVSKQYVIENCSNVVDFSNTLTDQINTIKVGDLGKTYKILSFYSDLNKCIIDISGAMREGAYLIWTVGIRKVAFKDIKMNEILEELAINHNLELIYDFEREIQKKRMPDMNAYKGEKNNLIKTMKKEIVMIFKKFNVPD